MVVASPAETSSVAVIGRHHRPVLSNQRKLKEEAAQFGVHGQASHHEALRVTHDGQLISFVRHNRTFANLSRAVDLHRPVRKQRALVALRTQTVIRRNAREQTQQHEGASVHQAPGAPAPPAAPAPVAPIDLTGQIVGVLQVCFAMTGLFVCMGFLCFTAFRGSVENMVQMDSMEPMAPRRSVKNTERLAPRVRAIQEEKKRVNLCAKSASIQGLQRDLADAGVMFNASKSTGLVQALYREVQAETCGVMWISDPESGRRLIRLVRLFRGLVTLRSEDNGESVLIEESRTMHSGIDGKAITDRIERPVTFKLKLDEAKPLQTGMGLMSSSLNLKQMWQDKYLKPENSAPYSYVEEEDSKHYPGLATWYLIEEWCFQIDGSGMPEEDCTVLGLPDRQRFKTVSSNSAQAEVTHAWKWLPRDAVAQASWITKEASKNVSVGHFQDLSRQHHAGSAGRSASPEMSDEQKVDRFRSDEQKVEGRRSVRSGAMQATKSNRYSRQGSRASSQSRRTSERRSRSRPVSDADDK